MAEQHQPHRPREEDLRPHEPIKYGDVFNVSSELADKPVTPRDAAKVQAAETAMLGKTLKGGPASVMQSAANFNVGAGFLSPENATENVVGQKGVSFSQTEDRGNRVITESIGGQVVGKYVAPVGHAKDPEGSMGDDTVTVGEALEATAISIGDKPVDRKDAAAIQTAENRVTGGNTTPGGVAAAAQAAAARNERDMESKVTIADVLTDAMDKLPRDRAVTSDDAEAVVGAELRNSPEMKTTPGGVADSMSAGARLNQQS